MSVLSLQNVTKLYNVGDTSVRALNQVDCEIRDGDFVAILGPSGSGKSTLMHIMGFLDRPSSGEIYFEGKPMSGADENTRSTLRSEKIGFVFQAYNLLPRLDLVRNTVLPLSYHRRRDANMKQRARSVLEQVGLGARVMHRPSQLSGGEKQRAAIARALVNGPRLILADEPTGNLDSVTARGILELFDELNNEGKTIVLVTHDEQVAARAKRQVRMLDGRAQEQV